MSFLLEPMSLLDLLAFLAGAAIGKAIVRRVTGGDRR